MREKGGWAEQKCKTAPSVGGSMKGSAQQRMREGNEGNCGEKGMRVLKKEIRGEMQALINYTGC